MSRKSIFERLQPKVDLTVEYLKFEKIICNEQELGFTINYILEQNFRTWKYRGNFLSLAEIRNNFGFNLEDFEPIPGLIDKHIDINDFFLYCELIANLANTFFESIREYGLASRCRSVIDTMKVDLQVLNHSFKSLEDGRIIVIEINPATTAVSDIVELSLADKVIEYNHFLLRGDLIKKRTILLALSDKYDAIKSKLKSCNSALDERIAFLLNNLNIRHNNKDPQSKDYKPFVAAMTDTDLENWYDETYQTLLFTLLTVDQADRNKAIDELKISISV